MAIPLFTPDYLASPTMFGAISPTTAKIMAEAGRNISERIEKNALRFEAQKKAPEIAQLLGQGMTLASQGDPTGFEYLAQASALGAGNPLLSAMSRDAIGEGSRMMNTYMDNAISEARLVNESTRLDTVLDRQDKSARDTLYRQREDDWRAREAAREAANVKAKNEYQRMQIAEEERAKLEGTAPRKIPPPEEIPPLPKPEYPAPMEGSLPVRSGVEASNDLLPPPRTPAPNTSRRPGQGRNYVANTASVPLAPMRMDDTFVPGEGPVASEEPVAQAQPVSAQPAEEKKPLVNESIQAQSKENLEERTVGGSGPGTGGMVITFPKPKASGVEKTTSIPNAAGGTDSYKIKPSDDPFQQLADSSDVVNTDPNFAKWVARQGLTGKQIVVRPTDKKEEFQPYAIDRNGSETPFGKVKADGAPAGATQTITKEVNDAFNQAQSLMRGKLKGKYEISYDVGEEAQNAARQQGIKSVLAETDPSKRQEVLKGVNAQLKMLRTPPITEKDLKEKATAPTQEGQIIAGDSSKTPWTVGMLPRAVGAVGKFFSPKSRTSDFSEDEEIFSDTFR